MKQLVDAYFERVRQNLLKVLQKGKIANGFMYSIHQKKYLQMFLDDGEGSLDNNVAEQTSRPICVGKKNGVTIDTVARAESSAIICSIE